MNQTTSFDTTGRGIKARAVLVTSKTRSHLFYFCGIRLQSPDRRGCFGGKRSRTTGVAVEARQWIRQSLNAGRDYRMVVDKAEEKTETYTLLPGHELRIEVEWSKSITVTLRDGEAEIFGTSLILGQKTKISGQKVAIFSWQGCVVEVKGVPEVVYAAEETPMAQYVNIHDILHAQRDGALHGKCEPPRVMIVGPSDSGKSTLCKILLNYAVRAGKAPVFADVDIGQGSLTVPGCIAACVVENPVDVEEGGFPGEPPIVFYYGSVSPSENASLYKHCVERLMAVLEDRGARDPAAAAAGMIVNSMGWVEGLGYQLLLHSIETMKINTVLVVGQDRLHSQMNSALGGKGITVVKVPKSDGVVLRSKEYRSDARRRRVEEYFYGIQRDLHPASQTAKIGEFQLYKVGGGPKAPTSALPIGATSVSDPLKISKVSDLRESMFTMVAVSHATSPELLVSTNVAGFIYIQDVDTEKGTVTFLAPRAGPLPNMLMLGGSYKTYLE